MIFRAAVAASLLTVAATAATAAPAATAVPVDRTRPYAFMQGDTVLVLGNALLERRFRWNGGNLMTLSLEDRTTGAMFRSVRTLPDFVFTRNAAAAGSDGRLTVDTLPATACADRKSVV